MKRFLQFSSLAGTLVGTPADSTPPPSQEEEGTPTPSSVDATDIPLPDLTILPLDATSREQPPPASKEQPPMASPHLLVGGASMYERSQFGVPSMLSVSFIDDTQQQVRSCNVLLKHLPLDSSLPHMSMYQLARTACFTYTILVTISMVTPLLPLNYW